MNINKTSAKINGPICVRNICRQSIFISTINIKRMFAHYKGLVILAFVIEGNYIKQVYAIFFSRTKCVEIKDEERLKNGRIQLWIPIVIY